MCLPVFSQENQSISINISASYSYYFDYSLGYKYSEFKFIDFDTEYAYNLQLSMGLDLYKKVNALVDFNIKDQNMKKAIQIASKIGAKWFGIQFDYEKAEGKMAWIKSPVTYMNDLPQTFEHTIKTVGLMSPSLNYNGYEFRGGFIWVSIDTPTTLLFIENNGGYHRIYYEQNPFNMYGLRISTIPIDTKSLGSILENNFGISLEGIINDIYLFTKFDFDFIVGVYKPDKNKIKAINPDHEKLIDDFIMPAMRSRMLFGLDYLLPFSYNNIITKLGLGCDFTYCTFLPELLKRQGEAYWWTTPNFSGFGIYARLDIKF